MKKGIRILWLFLGGLLPLPTADATPPADPLTALIQEAIRRVVRQVDLSIQRRQNAVIRLQNAQKVLENTMTRLHLDEIADWVRQQRDLYQEYYEELKKVKAVIASYYRIKEIADKQARIVTQYRTAWARFQRDDHFSPDERAYLLRVYTGMLEETARSVDLLTRVVRSFTTQMSDAQRLALIDQVARQVNRIDGELSNFNRENQSLSLSRAKEASDAKQTRALYGLDDA
ncbi:hypothetical protein GCM10027275_42890 [Rhabdobacter roseus]|uniref:Conjugal transfer protein TraI n=1 Tax=Rhabdobacter roseus TaxID=1655419 RepID=A0A840TYM9_9BACT|nr:conjugal transfer protein TraI [Rhabdobacter roseus]MBB5286657.1 hypothetical protein [Rhabdobacter roseus]